MVKLTQGFELDHGIVTRGYTWQMGVTPACHEQSCCLYIPPSIIQSFTFMVHFEGYLFVYRDCGFE